MATSNIEEVRKQANLKLLQRTCGNHIVGIEKAATHVVLYEYKSSWHKVDIEGSCFLVTTRVAPYYQLIILNRNSDENFCMDVSGTLQAQHQEPYLIVKQSVIKGIWFHSPEERAEMFNVIQEIIQKLKQGHVPVASLGINLTGNTTSPGDPTPVDPQTLAALLSPMAVTAAAAATPPPASNGTTTPPTPGVALDKKALQLALLSLIQDDRFLDLLHSQYQRVIKNRIKRGGAPGS